MRDGGAYRHGVQHIGQHEIGGIARCAADFERAIDADAGPPDDIRMSKHRLNHQARPYCSGRAVDRVWIRQRRASSILNPFSLCATAPCKADWAACS